MYYFTSDIHFNNEDTLRVEKRPFNSIREFDAKIIRLWNKQIKKEDVIYVIGDFMDCDSENSDSWIKAVSYVRKIKASVVLIVGNNEERIIKYYFDNDFEKFRVYCQEKGFKEVYKNLIIEFKNNKFYLTHEPKNYKEGFINLFGHVHKAMGVYKPFGFNVSCDLNYFRLLSENDILSYIDMKESYWDKDDNLKL